MKINRIKFFSAAILGILFSGGSALAVTISTNIPGVTAASSPGGYINAFYKFSLMISGILAFGAIVYGGVKYTLAAGNPSGQTEGKEWVKGALTGLLLLVGAYTILNIINPNITSLSLPGFPPLAAGNSLVGSSAAIDCARYVTPQGCNNVTGCIWTTSCVVATQSNSGAAPRVSVGGGPYVFGGQIPVNVSNIPTDGTVSFFINGSHYEDVAADQLNGYTIVPNAGSGFNTGISSPNTLTAEVFDATGGQIGGDITAGRFTIVGSCSSDSSQPTCSDDGCNWNPNNNTCGGWQ